MSDLKDAILDAKYIDMVSLADFVVRDCGLPDSDDDGNPMPQQNEIAAAIFRWAAMQGSDDKAIAEDTSDKIADVVKTASEAVTEDDVQVNAPTAWPNTEKKKKSDKAARGNH